LTDLAKIPLRGEGPVTWEDLRMLMREVLAKQDPRYPQNDFAASLIAHNDGTATIGTAATVTSQRTLPMVNAGGRLSAQSVTPLTSTGSPSVAQIQVAAHTLQFGFGQVSYASGSIAGLTPSTEYHVYTDDNYTGGAVTYSATTNRQTVVSARNRYHVGTIITANSSTSKSITGATSASPIELTAASHTFTTGDLVTFVDMPDDFAALNSNTYTITVTSSNTFTVPVDGSLFIPYVGPAGTVTRVSVATGGRAGGGWDYNSDYPIP
jgi:hypothetical protein